MKELLIVITRNDSYRNKVLNELNNYDVHGTVMSATNIRHAILQSDVEPLPIFGGLRQLTENERELNTTVFALIETETESQLIEAIRQIPKDEDDEGILFTLPISNYEELRK